MNFVDPPLIGNNKSACIFVFDNKSSISAELCLKLVRLMVAVTY